MVIMNGKINLATILHADKTELIKICRAMKFSTHGSNEQLRERIIRHIFPMDKSPGEKEPEFIGKLNINTARVDQFLLWPYIGKTTVDNIMEYRQKFGRFHTMEEMLNVKGIGIKTFGLLRKFLSTNGPTTLRIRRDGEEIEEYMKIKEIEEAIRKKEHELKDWEEAIETDHEEIEEQQQEIQKEQEELLAKEMAIIVKEKEIEELKIQLTTKEEKITELKEKMETTYGEIETGNLIPKQKVQETVEAFKKHEEDLKSSYKNLLSNYNETKEELVCLIDENDELRGALRGVMKKQSQITSIQDDLRKAYEKNILEQKELNAKKKGLDQLEKKLRKQDGTLKTKDETLKTQQSALRSQTTDLKKEINSAFRKLEREQRALARERKELDTLFEAYNKKIALTGALNINKASREEMSLWPYLSDIIITNIIRYRKEHGAFRRLDELKEVDGIGEETYRLLLPFIRLKGETKLRIRLGKESTEAIEELIKLENELLLKKKEFHLKLDELDGKFARKEEELETSASKHEKYLREKYTLMEKELLDKIKKKEESLVEQFMERQRNLEEKYQKQLVQLKQEKHAFEKEKEKLNKEHEEKNKELDTKADDILLKTAIHDKQLALHAKININNATKQELCLWPHITPTIAAGIIAYRRKHPRFTSVRELMNVKGIGRETYTILAPFITLTGPTGIEFKRRDELVDVFRELESERKELEAQKKILMERKDALSELYEEKEKDELKLKELQKEYNERKRAIDEIYEERLKLLEEAGLAKKEYIKKKEELDVLYQEKVSGKEQEFKERESELQKGFEEKKHYLEEEYQNKYEEREAELAEKENYYIYRMEQLTKQEGTIVEREEIQERGAILFGRINLNKAAKEELLLWPHITATVADEIIEYRTKYGSFNDVDELKSVKGIGEESYQLLRPFVDVKGTTGLKINEGFNADTVLDDLEERKQGMLEQKREYHVRKRELEWEYQERFGATIKALKQRDKELNAEKDRFEEEMKSRRDEFESEMENKHAKIQGRDDSLKEMKRDLKRYERKLKRRAKNLDNVDDKLTERKTVLEKNATLFGRLNINTATKQELMLWPHITATLADRIIDYRKKRRFRRVEELKEIKGIGGEAYQELRPFLASSGKTRLKVTVGDEVYGLMDDLKKRHEEMVEARTGYHREKRELQDVYHEKVETGLRKTKNAQKKLRRDKSDFNKQKKEMAAKSKELDQREEKLKEEEEIVELNALLLGKINLNTATEEELIQWPHINKKIAKGIIDYREKFGGFKIVEEFKDVKGIGDETYKLLRPFITLSGKTGFTINLHDKKTEELRQVEEHIQKTAESYQKKSELLEENLQDILELKDTVDKDESQIKGNIEEIETLKSKVTEKYQRMEELKNKMDEMHDTMGTILTGGKLEGISVRALLPKEELEAFEKEKERLEEQGEELNELQGKLDKEREQLGYASKFRVAIPLEIEVGDDPIEKDKIIVKDEKGDFIREVSLARHGKKIDEKLYSVVLPEIPAGRRYTIIRDNGEGKQYIIVKNYPAKVVEQ